MDELQKKVIYEIRKEKLKARIPLVILILISFLIYNAWLPAAFLKWLAALILVIYLAIGFYYQKKLRKELNKITEKDADIHNDHVSQKPD